MFRLEKELRFEASHFLPGHNGKCRRLHGHSWRAILILEAHDLQIQGPSTGMVLDFGDVSSAARRLLDDKLDHWHLNESTGLKNPTSEELARYIFNTLKPNINLLKAVRVHETCTSACEYQP